MSSVWADREAHNDFLRARRRALFNQIVDLVQGRSSNLLSFEEVRTRLNVRGQRYLGLRSVPLDQIIGSEGRYADFDRRFLPRHDATSTRWRRVDRAHIEQVSLPPVDLYKVADVYFVKDGNHRVSVARQQGQIDIDAYVIELQVDVPLDNSLSTRDLLLMEEYSDFLEWTELGRLRPEQRIQFSELGGYLELVRHINAHRFFLGQDLQRAIPRDEAVMSWYDHVYMPIVRVIREKSMLALFPGRTEADLYLWIIDHRWQMLQRAGQDPGPEIAADDYVSSVRRPNAGDLLQSAAGAALAAVRRLFDRGMAPPS